MIRINLLPHREQKRQARIRRFIAFLGIFALGGIVAVGGGYLYLSQRIDVQKERNDFLTNEISMLDRQLNEIETLKKERQDLLDRKAVVERLQENRAEAVKVMDQLVRQTPEGIYLKTVSQEDVTLTIAGNAQSSARVATFMRALEDSTQFESPVLGEIKAADEAGQRLSAFTLKVQITRQSTAKPAGDKQAGDKQSGDKTPKKEG